ncbi:response regulator [Nafulsella turpanensis]|uniref:response regulator n=1 Tax=Nafulsella turpanensis TaxID=1265690 RepID=UPI00038184DA|nr:response regulator [Nafulsella turpanensis]
MPGKLNSILLVDDDRTTNHFNKLLLEGMDLAESIQIAYDGQEALSLIGDGTANAKGMPSPQASLVFLDLYMPMMNGLEFLRALEKHNKDWRQEFYVVLLTSGNQAADIELAKSYKVANVLKKPLTTEKVKLVLKEAFKG